MRIEINRVEPAFEGISFGDVGPYEKVVGRAFGAVDPVHRLNAEIVNLNNAPKNEAGLVEYWADFCLLKPVDLRKGSRRMLCDLLNRGDKLALIDINDAPRGPTSNGLETPTDAGNGFLMRQGYVILFNAWQGGVADEEGHMLADLPVATDNGTPIVQTSRDEIVFAHTNSPAIAPLAYPSHSTDQSDATLTVRQHEKDERIPVPANQWRYRSAREIEVDLVDGFDAGALYEFIYPACDPIVMGLGFAVVRDVVTFMRYAAADDEGNANPLDLDGSGPAIDHVIAYGRSQPGRVLREFVHEGFNEEPEGRRVLDGVFVSLTGSRRIPLNEPFTQPGRFVRQHEDHLYPGDQFPFTYATRTDSINGKTDGILARSQATGTCPKMMHVDSSTEFWQGRSSLIVADEHGESVPLPDDVRAYLMSGSGHAGTAMFTHAEAFFKPAKYDLNRMDYGALNRALIAALDAWASSGTLPPTSRYPNLDDGTLVPPTPQESVGFPAIPGVNLPSFVNELCERDNSQQPPVPIAGHDYPLLVPTVDADGNEIAGIRSPDVAAPLGTLTGWNIRGPGFAEGALMVVGSFMPFARTAAERIASGDPRPSLAERYPSHADYVDAVSRAAAELQEKRLLLAEDVERYIAAAKAASVGGG